MFLTLALIGNGIIIFSELNKDVCNGHHSMSHMTTPSEMYKNTMKTLTYLDTILPPKSYVFLGGLANGTILYDVMHARYHPLGQLKYVIDLSQTVLAKT